MDNDPLSILRAQVEAATPGEWSVDHGREKSQPDAWATILAPDGSVLFDTINGENVLLIDEDWDANWHDLTGDRNAALIVTAVAIIRRMVSDEGIEQAARAICSAWEYQWDGDPDRDDDVTPEVSDGERPSKALFRTAAKVALSSLLTGGV